MTGRVLVPERPIVAALLAGGPVVVHAAELVDEDLRAIAIAVIALGAWRSLVTTSLEDLVDELGGDALAPELLDVAGATRRAA